MSDTELHTVETDATKALADTKAEISKLETDETKVVVWSKAHVAIVWGVVGALAGGIAVHLMEHLKL